MRHISPGVYCRETDFPKRQNRIKHNNSKGFINIKNNSSSSEKKNNCINFEDEEVERICIENFSINNECLTYEDAKNVLDIGTIFRNNTSIHTLTDLKYLENLTSVTSSCFSGCSNVTDIALPKSITSIGGACFNNCVNLKRIMLFSQTPPRLGHEGVNDGTIMVDYLPFDIRRIKTNYILHIFVPKGCLTIYKNNQDYRNLNIVEMYE